MKKIIIFLVLSVVFLIQSSPANAQSTYGSPGICETNCEGGNCSQILPDRWQCDLPAPTSKPVSCGNNNRCEPGNKCANPECVPVVGASGRSATCVCVPKATNPGGNVLSPVTPVPTRGSAGTTSGSNGPAPDFAKIAGFAEAPLPGSLGEIISNFVPYIFGAAGIILFFYLIWGGFSWMTAKGDPKATASAREKITKAIVGFAIIFTAYWLTQILGLIFGISQFKDIFR